MQKSLNWFYRVFIFSIVCFWKVVFSRKFADQVYALRQELKSPPPAPVEVPAPEPVAQVASPLPPQPHEAMVDGVYLLTLLQRSGRLIDFLQQEIASFSDKEVGEAARVVHQGCRGVLKEYFTLERIRPEEEGQRVKIEKGFEANEVRLTGNVRGEAPFQGELIHHGWKVTETRLPQLTDPQARFVICPAEVQL